MKILSISISRGVLEKDSSVQKRILEQAALVDEMHIIVYTPKGFDTVVVDNLHIHPTNSLSKLTFVHDATRIAYKLIKEGLQFDLCTTQDPFETALVGVKLKKKFRIPLHIQEHTDLFREKYWRHESVLNFLRYPLGKRNLKRANRIRTVNQKSANFLQSSFGISKHKIDIFPVVTHTAQYENATVNSELAGKYKDDFVILTACRLVKQKNLPLLLRTFKEIKKQRSNAKLLIIGSGPEETQLKKLVATFDCADSIQFIDWTDQLASYYKIADVFVVSSNYEGYCRTAAEANAAGCKVVMTNVGLAGEYFIDGVHGSVVATDSQEDLKSAILSDIPHQKMDAIDEGNEAYLQSWINTTKKNMLFICQTIKDDDPLLGFTTGWVNALSEYFNIDVIALGAEKHSLSKNCTLHSLGKEHNNSKVSQLKNLHLLIKNLKLSNDVVFAHMNPIWTLLYRLFSLSFTTPLYMWYAHGKVTHLLRVATFLCEKVFTSTNEGFRINTPKKTLIGQAIDTSIFYPQQSAKDSQTAKLLYVGRISPVKNIEIIFEAIPNLNQPITLDVVGFCTDHDYLDTLHQLCDTLSITHQVNFIGPVAQSELPEIYREADLMINPSNTGSLDKTGLEAMMCNTPILTCNEAYSFLPDEYLFQDLKDLTYKCNNILNQDKAKDHSGHVCHHSVHAWSQQINQHIN